MLNLVVSGPMEFDGKSLRPIVVEGFEIGQRVYQASESEECTIVGQDEHGYIVIFDDGRMHRSQRKDSNSPLCRIHDISCPEFGETPEMYIEGPERIAELFRIHNAYLKAQDEKLAREREQHEIDRLKAIAQLRFEYPWAVAQDDKISSHARAAKNMRKELGKAFPAVKFSVKARSFAGGDSIDVYWTLGPTDKEVEDITNKYIYGTFDGMQDLAGEDRSAYGKAVDLVLGRTRFVSVHREYPRELLEKVGAMIAEIQGVEYAGQDTVVMPSATYPRESAGWAAGHLIRLTSFRPGFTLDDAFTVESAMTEEDQDFDHWVKIVFASPVIVRTAPEEQAPETEPTSTAGNGVSLTENEEKDGYEIRAVRDLTQGERDALWANGFRWSRRQQLYWAKRTADRLAFAKSLIG